MIEAQEKVFEDSYKVFSDCNDIETLYDTFMKEVTKYDSFEGIYACGKAVQKREEELEKGKGNAECDFVPDCE